MQLAFCVNAAASCAADTPVVWTASVKVSSRKGGFDGPLGTEHDPG